MKWLKEKMISSDLLRHNAVFFVGTMVISAFNYLYYPVLSRLVSVSEFGEIQAVISLFMQLGIVLTAYGYVITSIVANSDGRLNKSSAKTLLRLEQTMLMVAIIIVPLLFLATYFFGDSFKFGSLTAMLLVGILIVINVPSTTRTYVLQGEKKLKEVSIGGSVFAIGKLVVTVGLIYALTNNVVAAMLSYVIAQLLSLWYLRSRTKDRYVPIGDAFKFKHLFADTKAKDLIAHYGRYGIFIFLTLSGLALLYSSDTIVARLFFDEYQVGLYSGIVSVARIIFFVTASVAGVLIASVRLGETANNRRIFIRSLVLIAAVGLIGVLAFSLFKEFFVGLLVGGDYVASAKWLPLLSLTMLFCSIANLAAIYQIATRNYRAIVPVVLGVLLFTFGIFTYVDTVERFIQTLLAANLLVVVLLLVQIFVRRS